MARAETRNAADRRDVRGADRREEYRERRWRNALRAVMATPEGRMVFGEHDRGIFARAGIFKSSFHSHGSVFALNEGRRQLGLELLSLLQDDHGTYLQMEVEMRALATGDDALTEAAHTKTAEEQTS